jgi:two-component system, sensor histidine kinase
MNRKNKILIVDDKLENLIALEKILSSFDVEFERALSGNEALVKTIDHNFALALIDVQMPDMDGYETVKLLRQVNHTMYLPVIFISAIYSENHFLIEGIEAGAIDFITKPIIPRILAGKVKLFLDLHNQKMKLIQEIEQRRKSEQILLSKERELKEAKLKAEQADQLKTAFLANISHEIRTPMNSIIGFSNLLKNPELDYEDQIKYINYINNSGESLLNLINDIIEFAKLESDHIKIIKETVNVQNVFKEMLDTYRSEIYRREKSEIEIIIDKEESKDSILIYTDYYRFKQILSNLIMNAIKFTLKGQIKIGYSVKENQIEFYVSDSGIGIPEEKINKIFERFIQLESNPNNNLSGTGLGLAISKRLVELLGGEISVSSQEGVGSIFTFFLPYKANIQSDSLSSKNNTLFQSDDIDLKGRKVIVAEDEEINFFFLKEALRKSEMEILWAHNGLEAIKLFKENMDITLVLMDIKMPIMDGYEAMAEIKKIRPIPVIAQTAYAMAGEKEQMLKAGFDFCLTKPLNIQLLLSTISKFISVAY